MFGRSEVVFKVLCAGIGALVIWQGVRAIQRSDPLAGASIPALPSLPASTNTQAGARGTNTLVQGTNAVAKGTNAVAKGTNAVAQGTNAVAQGTNAVAQGTNAVAQGTNLVAQGTNAPVLSSTNKSPTDPTNSANPANLTAAQGTNASVPPSAGKARPNPAARPETARGMMNAGAIPGMPGQAPPLPPAVQARLDRIIESEILGPVMRPQPVALLGIVGTDAFVQAPNGQSGMIKEGEEMGGIKLLKLGINRALIEEAGEKKELTLFTGLGSESLLSKQTNSP